MDIVTVTCLRDIDDMLRQAESIEKFVEPCTHWVIVNDNNIDLFKEVLSQYYSRHFLNLINFSDYLLNKINCGYKRQQVLKLRMAKFLKEKYLVLDSKNFFIKQTNLNEFENQIGSGLLERVNCDHLFYSTIEQYKTILNYTKLDNLHLAIQTPFVIDPDILNSNLNLENLLYQFSKITPHMSEFFLYSLMYEKYKGVRISEEIEKSSKSIHYTAFEKIRSIENIIQMTYNSNVKVLALHRNYVNAIDNKEIEIFNKFLISLGFKNLLKEKDV